MTAFESCREAPPSLPPFDRERVRRALDRGEIVRILAELESGAITPMELEGILEERNKRLWYRRLLLTLFGR